MIKGGYKILDFRGFDCSGAGKTIPGIYEAIEGTTKACMCSGMVSNTTEYKDQFVSFKLNSTDWVAVLADGNTLRITDDDLVTIKNESEV